MSEPNQDQWFAVYPGSEKIDLGPKRYVAMFQIKMHAYEFVTRWAPHGYVEPITVVTDKDSASLA